MSEIRVDSIGNESNTGGPVLSGITTFSGQQYFIPPKGTTAERPSDCPPGSIRFNTDSAHLEYWNGSVWLEFEATVDVGDGGGVSGAKPSGHRGLFGGGYAPTDVNTIDFVTISTLGNASDFGDLTVRRRPGGAVSSSTRAIWWGGRQVGLTPSNVIDFVTISSTGNAQDFGDNATRLQFGTAVGNATRGVYGGGYEHSPASAVTNNLYYITIASTGNSVFFGDLAQSGGHHHLGAGCASSVRGVFAGGLNSPAQPINTIDFVTISTLGNSTDFGDLSQPRFGFAGCSNAVRGVFSGGSTTHPSVTKTNLIEFITIASTGNAIDFGDRTIADFYHGAACSPTRAVFAGDYQVVTMDAVEIMTTGNAFDFGDLTQGRLQNVGTSNGHGGL
jgi:hypothetical protein